MESCYIFPFPFYGFICGKVILLSELNFVSLLEFSRVSSKVTGKVLQCTFMFLCQVFCNEVKQVNFDYFLFPIHFVVCFA